MRLFALFTIALMLAACGGGGGGGGGGDSNGFGQQPGSTPAIGGAHSGEATFYGADGTGACLYEPSDDLMVAAMNSPQYANSTSCGMCVEVTGPKGTIVVRIVDLCPECPSGNLDLSEQAFEIIGEKHLGRVPIQWVPVECQVSGPLRLRYQDGSSQWWMGVQVRNSRVPIERVEIWRDGDFVPLARQAWNYSVTDNPGTGPFDFRITATDGRQVIETNIPLRDSQVVQGTQQF